MTATSSPLYREVQRYAELPPFTLLTAVGTLFGWFLIIWVVVLGRSLGALTMPTWLALVIGLALGLLAPLAYFRLQMVTEVYADRIRVNNGSSGNLVFPFSTVKELELRKDYIRGDYTPRNVGALPYTRTAYTVSSDEGVQLTLDDGRQILIGSKTPDDFWSVAEAAWRAIQVSVVAGE